MPGMIGRRGAASLAIVAEFRSALLAEGTLLFLVFVLLAIGWVACREMLLARARAWLAAQLHRWPREPAWRRVLRIGFGVLWIIDGLLQAQPAMPGGLPSQVIAPAAVGSPAWVIHVVDWGTLAWSGHPAQAAVSVVWIQLGIGIWLVSVSSPRWSRLAGLTSAAWGLVVWVFGEAFGGLLAPGASWLTGAPGAALLYAAGGALLALPARCWQTARLWPRILQVSGAVLVAFAALQAWPGGGFWQGWTVSRTGSRQLGPLPASISSMAADRQPAVLRDLISWFGAVVAGHGFAINLIAVVVLAGVGALLLTGRPILARAAAGAAIGFCLADWLLVQDLGVFGGLGTDPNSMLPQALFLAAGLVAATGTPASTASAAPGTEAARTSVPASTSEPASYSEPASTPTAASTPGPASASSPALAPAPPDALADSPGHRRAAFSRLGRAARRLAVAFGTAGASAVLTVWAVAMLVMGAAPMALATMDRGYNPSSASAVLNADSQAPGATAEPAAAGLARSSAASAHLVTSAAAGDATIASPSSSSCCRLSRP
jgi:hypothetical protein